jgi:hypothetical protein
MNPNGGLLLPNWPQYNTGSKQLLTLLDGLVPIILTQDTYREDAMNLLMELGLENPL